MENHNLKNDTLKNDTNSLSDILNSMNSQNAHSSTNLEYDLDGNKCINQEIIKELLGKNLDESENNKVLNLDNQKIENRVQLLTDDIDRRIGNYLLNELEKKQEYINELEEALKFQEKEINELKEKLDSFDKLELLNKIKSNMDLKLTRIENEISHHDNQEKKNVQIKKTQNKFLNDEEKFSYPKTNPDLVLRSEPINKIKTISKEEEEPRYNGVTILKKPKKEEEIKIVLDYETETCENDKSTDLIKQRRRARKL